MNIIKSTNTRLYST